MTILVINNKGQYNHRIQRSLQYLKIPSQLVPNTLSIEEIEAKNPTGIILGGGPSIKGAGNSEKYIMHFDIPILGICLGHQLIAKTYGGKVSTSETESYAQVKININNDSFDFGFNPEFFAHKLCQINIKTHEVSVFVFKSHRCKLVINAYDHLAFVFYSFKRIIFSVFFNLFTSRE